jgi:protein-tyrosine-phosphatase
MRLSTDAVPSLRCAAAGGAAPAPARAPARRAAAAAAPPRHAAAARAPRATPQEADAASLDVSSAVVDTAYRATPWAAESAEAAAPRRRARVLFVSESGVCRAPLAAALLDHFLAKHGLTDLVECEAAASRDFNVGQGPEPAAAAAAASLGLALRPSYWARQFRDSVDVVRADLIVAMDKYTAADVLREISVFETVNPAARYSAKVRRLGEFHPRLGAMSAREVATDQQDIDDPLYGNGGGADEAAAVAACVSLMGDACEGLALRLRALADEAAAASEGGLEAGVRPALAAWVAAEGEIEWMKPPMLRGGGGTDDRKE